MYNFNMRLKELRMNYKITQSKLAQMLHISQNTYSQYETEKHQIPIEMLITLSKIYNVSVDYILCLTNIDVPYPEN